VVGIRQLFVLPISVDVAAAAILLGLDLVDTPLLLFRKTDVIGIAIAVVERFAAQLVLKQKPLSL
jgi:hypothetical protein